MNCFLLRLSLTSLLIAMASLELPRIAGAGEAGVCRYCGVAHRAPWEGGSDGPSIRKYAPDRKVDVLNIRIDVTPDFEQRSIAAETTVTFTPIDKPVRELKLSATDLRFTEVRASVPLEDYVATDEEITLLFSRPLEPGERQSVTMRYTAEPKRGLYFRTAAQGYPEGDDHLWSQGEPHEAPHWFPAFDYPNERSSTEVICRVPQGMTVLSNGRVVSEQIDPKTGLKVVHWQQEKPHANYLVCLVTGYFRSLEKRHGDLPLRFYTQPSLIEHAANAFLDTDQIIAFFEQEIGVPFPWVKYDQVTIRDFTFGGMENTTLTTLTHRTLFTDATENIYSSRNLDAHETAHQWFGDYVTCEDWSHLWLNEGFATFYTHLYDGHKLGRDYMLYGLYRDATEDVLPQSKDTRPIAYRKYKQPMEQFDFRAYPKGSWVLHMLRSQLGESTYRRAIKSYLEKHALSSVVTSDLVAELEDASGLSLDRFFDQWVYHGGAPKLKVTYKWLPGEKLAHVHIEQTHEVSDEVLRFTLPTKLRFHHSSNVVDHEIVIDETEQDFYVPLDGKPEVVRFDPEYTLLAKVAFKKPQAMLERQLTLDGDMIGRLLAAVELGKKENKKSVEALNESLASDPFYGVRIAAARSLAKIDTQAALDALLAGRQQSDARVRQAVVQRIGTFYDDRAFEALQQTVQRESNPAVVATAVKALAKFGERATDTVVAALERPSFLNEVSLAAAISLGDSFDKETVGKTAQPMLGALGARNTFPGRRYGEALPALARVWRDAENTTPARLMLIGLLKDPAVAVRRSAAQALGELGDRRAIDSLEAVTASNDSGLAKAARNAIEAINKETPGLPAELTKLRDMVRELKEQQAELQETVEKLDEKAEAKE